MSHPHSPPHCSSPGRHQHGPHRHGGKVACAGRDNPRGELLHHPRREGGESGRGRRSARSPRADGWESGRRCVRPHATRRTTERWRRRGRRCGGPKPPLRSRHDPSGLPEGELHSGRLRSKYGVRRRPGPGRRIGPRRRGCAAPPARGPLRGFVGSSPGGPGGERESHLGPRARVRPAARRPIGRWTS